MPTTHVVFYQEETGEVPALAWIMALPARGPIKCLARLRRLQHRGPALRRPEADYLGEGLYELRIGLQGRNYRLLYFFHARTRAVAVHRVVKERRILPADMEWALDRKARFELHPDRHTYTEEIE